MEWPCKKPWLLSLGTMIVWFQVFGSINGCFEEEKVSLLDFKTAYSNDTLLPSWVDHSNCCEWERVTCDSSSGHVIHLSMENLNIRGCLEPKGLNWSLFKSFKELRTLNLSHNCFDDSIWKGDYRSNETLKRLETLDLSDNLFNESIMTLLSNLISLKNLILSYNNISGFFPNKEILLLRNLELLDLGYNHLHSASITQVNESNLRFKRLETLDLSSNSFNEIVLEYLIGFKSLKNLFLSRNWISGFFPSKELSLLKNLELIDLSYNSLNGTLEGLCKMKQLEELYLMDNNFIGALDTCISNLASLRVLGLSYNSLSGTIPEASITSLTSLEYLSLDGNKFEGTFSLNILANHSHLKVLQLGFMDSKTFQVDTENQPWNASFQLEHLYIPSCNVNLLTKSIPTFLSSQNSLKYIDISGDNLVGAFPTWLILNNSGLEGVDLSDNILTGPLKLPIVDLNHLIMDRLESLDISNNEIQGELPETIGFMFPNLVWLLLSSNKFYGHVPASIGEMTDLWRLDLSNNSFSGNLPHHILDGCISLADLLMDHNQFNGTLPSFAGNHLLYTLTVSRNNFEGPITEEICKLHLHNMDLSHNRLSGALPSCINMSAMRFINLQGNSLNGTIPESLFTSSSTLEFINLSDNNFSGTIPESINRLKSLSFLLLAGNRLQGEISPQICLLRNLLILDLSRNIFTGSVPPCFNRISFSPEDWGFEGNNEVLQIIIKGLPQSYKSLVHEMITALDLSSNQFTGEIPHQLGYLPDIHSLNLSHNHLNGSIPGSFHMLQNIESLDLSNNKLSGQIPLELQDLNFLSVFNVSYNNLSGIAPDKGQFGTFGPSSYEGNPYLYLNNTNRGIGTPPPPANPLDEGKKDDDSAIDITSFCWTFAASYVTVVIVLVSILWINPYWRSVWFYCVKRCLLKFCGQFLEDSLY